MKSSHLVFPILLAFLLSGHPEAAMRAGNVAEVCCFHYSTKALPVSWVRSYKLTRSSCSCQAVIFTTKRGKQVCFRPKAKWVQQYIS
ncbi:C-C motif chemokine 26 [Cavia porcellus]|uniref:C-C motif chemokine 26 n=1 Tax=Cavia porcellus TaxID=10141 RepID=UPI000184E04D|nr:C-C motif chemokine 26 [Cavia porcellus]